MPETEAELIARNAFLTNYRITPIWFPNGSYDYVEQILRLARNEMRYRGSIPGFKKKAINGSIPVVPEEPKPSPVIEAQSEPTGLREAWNSLMRFFGI